jgi:acyl-homoserine lactone acylase PvdQ
VGSSGTATIDMADVDASVQMLPMGASENPDSSFFESQPAYFLGLCG